MSHRHTSALVPTVIFVLLWSSGAIVSEIGLQYGSSVALLIRDPALFDLAIDSKPRGCDLMKIRINGIVCDRKMRTRAPSFSKRQAGLFSLS
jgi:hypothetical protein